MHLRDFRIGTRLGFGFGILLLILISMLVISNVVGANNQQKLVAGIGTANTKEMLANTMRAALLESAVAMRNIGIQTEVGAMQAEEDKTKTQGKRFVEAREKLIAMGLTAGEKKSLEELERIQNQMTAPFAEAMGQALAFNSEGAGKVLVSKVDPLSQQALNKINELIQAQSEASEYILGESTAANARLMYAFYLVAALALIIGIACAWMTARSITRPLHDAVTIAKKVAAGELGVRLDVKGKDEISELLQALKKMDESLVTIIGEVCGGTDTIASASKQIAFGNADLSSRTEEQASSLEETASSMEELTSTVKQNADNARQANQLAVIASEVAVKGGTVVSEVVRTMGSINESAKKIVDIIAVIDSIAFQTNILALNAAVEAARAGEQGRGFAVVASEVRNLAQRSAAAAKEIKTLIDNSVEKVDAGSKLVDQAGVTMQEVVGSIRRVTDIMAEISAASQEQTAGIEQVQQAITQMDQMTQQNAALVEESAAAAEAMQGQASKLAQTVSVFKLNGMLAVAPPPGGPAVALAPPQVKSLT